MQNLPPNANMPLGGRNLRRKKTKRDKHNQEDSDARHDASWQRSPRIRLEIKSFCHMFTLILVGPALLIVIFLSFVKLLQSARLYYYVRVAVYAALYISNLKKNLYMKKEAKKTMSIQPLGDRVLVRREDGEDEKTPSGIIIPDTAKKDKSKIGTVLAVGAGRVTDEGKTVAMSVKVGAKVIFNAGWDNEVEGADDEELFLVKESDILALIK